jgi:magnesium-transporting ATPase (P-type)
VAGLPSASVKPPDDPVAVESSRRPEPPDGAGVMPWHATSPRAALLALEADPSGLDASEVERRRRRFGANVLQRSAGESPAKLLWHQIHNPLIWMLVASAGLAVTLGKTLDGLVVRAVVVANGGIGFLQEFRASRAIGALLDLLPDEATAWRDGRRTTLAAGELVPGDIVDLTAGDKVPADLRLLETRGLQIDEASLTGESVPVTKDVAAVDPAAPVADRTSMAFSGTLVVNGTGTGVVASTGQATDMGKISAAVSPPVTSPATPRMAR